MMNRTKNPSINAPVVPGTATVVANPALTLLAANDAFYALFDGLSGSFACPQQDSSLFCLMPVSLAVRLQNMLAAGQALCEGLETCSSAHNNGKHSQQLTIHISAARVDGMEHEGYSVYHLLCTDLSELTEMRRTTALEKQKYDIISDLTEDISFEYDFASDTMTYAEKYRAIFGFPPEIPRFRARLAQGIYIDTISDFFRDSFISMVIPPEKTPECYANTINNGHRWFSLFCSCIEGETGTAVKAVGAIRNIDRQKREQLRLLDKSRIDTMTGLLNKSTTEEEIRKALNDSLPNTMGALMMIDIDNFKSVNDTLGHLAGDAVITQLARQLLRTFRHEDIVGRVGGDEFHVFMRGITDIASVHEKAQGICAAVRKLFITSDMDNVISISVGIACTEGDISYSELSRQADVALYQAKANGKNRYDFFGCISPFKSEEMKSRAASPLITRVARNSIVVDIIDTLFSIRDIRKGIDKALAFIGNTLRVGVILIYEKSFDFKTISVTHEWTIQQEWRSKHLFQNIPIDDIKLPRPTDSGGIFYCSDVHALSPKELTFSKDPSVTSFLQCDIVREGRVVGLISFEEHGNKRIWTQQEIDALILMSKLISGHISQKQSAKLLRQSNEATRDILNSLPNTFVCVISKTTHRLLYFNNRISEQFPRAEIGMTCHQLFKNREQPCDSCPKQRFEQENAFCTLLHDVPFGKAARLSVSSILWENREAAYVALISEHELSQEEREQQKKKEAYIHALCTLYDYVLDIDSSTGQYELLALAEDTRESFPSTGDYNSVHYAVAQNFISPEDQDIFRSRFNLQGMLQTFGNGTAAAEMEYKWRQKGLNLWKKRTALPYVREDNSLHILTYIQDITESKRMEHANRRLEQRYNTVFRQSCDVLSELNLATRELTRICFTGDPYDFPTCGDYNELFSLLLERVHPEDREIVQKHRNINALCEAFDLGDTEPASCQYRLYTESRLSWIESRAFFVIEDGEKTVFFLARDITAVKALEEEQYLEAQRFTIALRDTYTEIYELDTATDTSKLLFSNSDLLRPVGIDNLVESQTIIQNTIHPDDQQHVAASFSGTNLHAQFEQGNSEVTEEFRRFGFDDKYHWVSAMVVPLSEVNGVVRKAMILIKDISQRKEQEQLQRRAEQYNMALRNIYDELYEFNIAQDSYHRLFEVGEKYLTPPSAGRLSETTALIAETMIHPEDRMRFYAFFDLNTVRQSFAAGKTCTLEEFRRITQNGEYLWIAMAMFPVAAGEKDDEMYLLFNMDIDARKKAEAVTQQNILLERQRIADERYKIIVEQTKTLVFEWSPKDNSRYISPDLIHRFAGTYDDRDLMRIWQEDSVIHPEDQFAFKNFTQSCQNLEHSEMTVRFRKRDDSYIWCKVVLSCLHDEWDRPYRYIGTLNDVNNATRSVIALQYRAEYDTLTGVYNMQTFNARAANLLRENPERHYSIIRMDIDRFKVINDLYGMEEGDLLLKTLSKMLSERMTPYSVCGHISGDVFCACVDYTREQIIDFIDSMTEKLAKYPLSSRIVPSFGVCRVDNTDTPINVLCDWANLALKTVKGNVLVSHAFYDEKLRSRILDEKKIENEMYESLIQQEFHLFLQPKVHIPSSRIVGSEGLVRWKHPADGVIPPDRFIPLFEKNGFIIRLDEYIWEQACIALRDWSDRGLTPTPISVNVSRMHIHDTRLCEKLLALIKKYDLPPHMLELELTESVFLDSETQLFDSIRELRECGFLFSLDDFGAGYSSLNMLKSLPIKTVKIDRGFLNEVVATERGKTIIRHAIALTRDLDMEVIAEGVETRDHATFLMNAGCFMAQGFYYAPPVPLAVFEKMAFNNPCPFPFAPPLMQE